MVSIARPEGNYIPSLDGLRAVSITMVALKHAFPALPMASGFGVTVFFFISGYLITTLLYREIGSSGRIAFTAFYERRVLRLGPPLVITMAFGIALVLLGVAEGTLDPWVLLSQLFFFFNYYAYSAPPSVDGLQLLWSLSVEEHFYLVFPVLLLLSVRKGWAPMWLVWLSLAVLAWRIVKFGWLGFYEWQIYSLSDTRVDSMLWGCLLASMIERAGPVQMARLSRWQWPLIGAGLAILLVSFVVRDEFFRATWVYTLRGVGLLPLVMFAVLSPASMIFRPLNWGWVRTIGVYSYTIYLVHQVILFALERNFGSWHPVAIGALGLGLSLVYAAAMFRLVELPIKKLRQRLHREAAPSKPESVGLT